MAPHTTPQRDKIIMCIRNNNATHYIISSTIRTSSIMNLVRCFAAYLLVLSSSSALAVDDVVIPSSPANKIVEESDLTNDLLPAIATLASTTRVLKRPKLKNRKLVRRRRRQREAEENARYYVSNRDNMESMITPPHVGTAYTNNNNNNNIDEIEDRQLVVGGAEAVEDRHYYMVSLQYSKQHFCGGSLIARNVILTAAHCGAYDPIYAILGRHDLAHDTDGERIGIRDKVIHPRYDKLETDNDFMLLFLERPYTAKNVGMVKLNSDDAYPPAGVRVADMGWGDTMKDEGKHVASEALQRVYLEVLSNVDCDKSEGYYLDGTRGWTYGSCEDFITDNMLCTYKKDRGSCSGDSGGPLVVKPDISDGAQDVQVGVSSWMIDCAGNFPGVYARVSKGYAWIESEVCARSNEYACEAGFNCGNCDENGGIRIADNTGERIGAKPCPVCLNGLTVDPTMIIPYPEANGASCAHLMKFATAGVTQAVCNSMFQAETICCPILATNPCSACPDGITVDESVLVHPSSTKTCGDLVVDSMVSEEGSEVCSRMKNFKSVCCPYVNPNDRSANLYDDEWMTLDDDKWRL